MRVKRCFVLMGFGVKVDYKTNRSLDLDKTYKIIRAAVEEAGLECVRADDIVHSGIIDRPMYENLWSAEVAIADLSTSNENAIYELGVRHALKPRTTIVLAEKQFRFPFDLGHLVIRSYEHLGTGIDFEEADRLKKELVNAIRAIVEGGDVDSPVYTFLPRLRPPTVEPLAKDALLGRPAGPEVRGLEHIADFARRAGAIEGAGALLESFRGAHEREEASAVLASVRDDGRGADDPAKELGAAAGAGAGGGERFSALLEAFREAKGRADFALARRYLEKLGELRRDDPYLVQQLALATYKSERPNALDSLREAQRILRRLGPETSGDAETLSLWGAIHEGMWHATRERAMLDESIAAYERCFCIKRDPHNGIHYVNLLGERARQQLDPDEATADRITARRVARRLLALVDNALAALPRDRAGALQEKEEGFWLAMARVEAQFAFGDPSAHRALAELSAGAPEPSMQRAIDELKAALVGRI